jgi:hypothetical protein
MNSNALQESSWRSEREGRKDGWIKERVMVRSKIDELLRWWQWWIRRKRWKMSFGSRW